MDTPRSSVRPRQEVFFCHSESVATSGMTSAIQRAFPQDQAVPENVF